VDDCSNISKKNVEQEKDAPIEPKTSIDRNICKVCQGAKALEVVTSSMPS